MKKIFSILLTMVIIASMFIACSKENSEAVNGTTEPTTSTAEAVNAVVEEMTEDINIENITTDENGNDVIVGTDNNGNTVEIKSDKDGKVTKTVTDKDTGKKTEQTTTVTTTKPADKPVTTTKAQSNTTTKKTETTTKKSETTTKKPAATTTKPATTAHTHNWVSKSKQVLVKEAWDETVYETVEKHEEHRICNACGLDESAAWRKDHQGCSSVIMFHTKHINETDCTGGYHSEIVTVTEKVPKTVHHDAQYKTETWYECSCGAKK